MSNSPKQNTPEQQPDPIGVDVVVVTHHLGLTVPEVTALRAQVRAAGACFKTTKNRLARRALKGTPFEGVDGLFKGPTAVAYSKDPVAAAKAVADYAKTNAKLEILGAAVGSELLDAEGVKALAALPSLDVLRARLLGQLRARIASAAFPAAAEPANPEPAAAAPEPTPAEILQHAQTLLASLRASGALRPASHWSDAG